MAILFSFCDAHWILPWILPFFLGWFFGSRLLGGYKNRIRDMEATQLREQQRFASLESDLNAYRTKEAENIAIATDASFSFDEERANYKEEISDLKQRLLTAEASGSQADDGANLQARVDVLESELAHERAKNQENIETLGGKSGQHSGSGPEIDALKSRVEELEAELADEKNRPSKSSDQNFADVAPGESSGLSSGFTQTPEVSALRSRITELEAELAATDDAGLRSKLTALEADLALEKGKSYELSETSSEESPVVAQLRNKLLQTEAELALSKGGTYEQKEVANDNQEIVALRNKLLQTEAELALSKGGTYEQKEVANDNPDTVNLRNRLLQTEAELALLKGNDYELKEAGTNPAISSELSSQRRKIAKLEKALALQKGYNAITDKSAAVKKKNAKKKAKKTKAKQVSAKGAKKEKATKKKKLKAGTKAATKKGGTKAATKKASANSIAKKANKAGAKTKAKASQKSAVKSKSKTAKKSSTKAKAKPTIKKKATAKKSTSAAKKTKVKAKKTPAKKTPSSAKSGRFSKAKEGDLTIIEGIGPKTAAMLKRKGIKTWADLAVKTPGQLKELLSTQKGLAHIDPSTWTRQANLAAGGQWTRLANLQDDLQGGKATKTKKSAKRKTSKAKSSKKSTSKSESFNIQVNSKLKNTNYQLIEGIGPKMNQLLIKEGIKSWTELASYSPGELRGLLDKHGDKYKILDVKTWSKQASYAAKGQWEKLIQYQKKDGSKSKAEKQLRSLGVIKSINKQDLKLIEGVGPKIESLLKKAGIKTLGDLSKASKTKLKKILNDAGARYALADPSHWSKQASLANAGKLTELKKLQDSI